MNPKSIAWLRNLHACGEAVEWAGEQKSAAEAWKNCERGEWMLWLLGKLSGKPESEKRKRLAACECARLSLKYVPKGEKRPLVAIQTAEKWTRGEATIEEVRTTAHAATYAATYAALAALAARKKVLSRCADIVRKHYPNPPRIRGKA